MATGSDAPALRALRAKTEMETIAASCRGWLFTQPSNSSRGFARAVYTTLVSREDRSIGIWSATVETVDGSTWQRRVCLRTFESTNDWHVCAHAQMCMPTCVASEPPVQPGSRGRRGREVLRTPSEKRVNPCTEPVKRNKGLTLPSARQGGCECRGDCPSPGTGARSVTQWQCRGLAHPLDRSKGRGSEAGLDVERRARLQSRS
jgi:hypothetical protein